MYNEWSIIEVNTLFEENKLSVLHKLPYINGQHIVNAVIRPLAGNMIKGSSLNSVKESHTSMNQQQTGNHDCLTSDPETVNYLRTDRDVEWVMEVICYGLSLPINTTEQHEAIRDCVHIYCEWIYALAPQLQESSVKLIPSPVLNDPNRYFRRIIQHLYNIFMPRTTTSGHGSSSSTPSDLNFTDIISRQAMLCHRVLRTIAQITQDEANLMDRETWDLLLLFLLAINNSLLAPPADKEDIGRTKLCERVVSVLFEIWIIACYKYFPNPSFWKTFHHLCCFWRHQPALIDQWSRVCLVFTQRLLQLTNNIASNLSSSDSTLLSSYCTQLVSKMNKDTVSEAWYKFLHTIGNPVDLHLSITIAKTCKFQSPSDNSGGGSVSGGGGGVDPTKHYPYLNELPLIFYKAMRGLSMLVDTFLGLPIEFDTDTSDTESIKSQQSVASNPSLHRKQSNPKSIIPQKVGKKPSLLLGLSHPNKPAPLVTTPTGSNPPIFQPPISTIRPIRALTFSQSKPKVNSILNVLGNWLFNACMITTKYFPSNDIIQDDKVERSASAASFGSNVDNSQKDLFTNEGINSEGIPYLLPENFEAGQGEAIGALCRLFTSKKSDEEISPVYLARFYLALQHGLSAKNTPKSQVLSSILLNGVKLFQVNLNGINILIPDFLKAMEMVINEIDNDSKGNPSVATVDLRRACIKLLLSMLSFPLHFNALPIKDSLTNSSSITFRSLRPRFINLIINALRSEQDSLNVQMLLSGFLICVKESVLYEKSSSRLNASPSDSISSVNKESSPICESTSHHIESSLNYHGRSPHLSTSFLGRGGIPDTARDIHSRSLNLVCQLLSNNWKNDTQVSLAALETLVGLARIKFTQTDEVFIASLTDESKIVTKWICDFITYQCSRPPPHHSKDMHSTIVAAYQCLNVWFHEHSYLLNDKECVNYLMDVIELGISGSKSRTNSCLILKSQKELKPASMRVKEAAEFLLTCLINHFGSCPPAPCPPEAVTGCCLLDEIAILKSLGIEIELEPAGSCSKYFKYFVAENSILLAFVDHVATKQSICIIRSPFGKYCWSMNFQVLPVKNPKQTVSNVSRPVPLKTQSSKRYPIPRFFPESLEKIPLTKLDTVVPKLSTTIQSNTELKAAHEKVVKILEKQVQEERELEKRCLPLILFSECKPPKAKEEMECSRLILSQLGFLLLDPDSKLSGSTFRNPLIYLDSKNGDIFTEIKALDMISTRTSDTAFVFYVRKGRIHPQEILNSVSSRHYVSPQFIDFLHCLGCPMKVSQHFGWTGNVFTSWKTKHEEAPNSLQESINDHGGSAFDGHRMTLYWADVCHEMAFVVPSGRFPEEDALSLESDSKGQSKSTEGSEAHVDIKSLSSLSDDGVSGSNLSRNLSETESNRNSWKKKKNQVSYVANIGCDTKIMVIWLESLEDESAIPISSLLLMTNTGVETTSCSRKDYIAILVHPFKNDLFAIRIISSHVKIPFGLPLVDGMVVSKTVLGFAVRTTCLNLCRRRRLDAENFQAPHIKRRLKIQEIAKKHETEGSNFYYSMFT